MRIIVILVSAIVLSACNNGGEVYGFKKQNLLKSDFKKLSTNNDNLIEISIPFKHGKVNFFNVSDLVDTCFAVPLETNSKNLIGRIDEIKIYKDNIYVVDKMLAKAVFVFDNKGKYIRKIGNSGHGPGEYVKPDGFEIDKINNELLVQSVSLRKILRYDLDGRFLGYKKVEIGNYDFKILKNGDFVFLAGDQGNYHLGELQNRLIYITDNNLNILKYGPVTSSDFQHIRTVRLGNMMVQNNNITSFSYKFSDTIFSVNEKGISAQYKLNFKYHPFKRNKYKNLNTNEFTALIKSQYPIPAIFNGSHFQNNDYLIINFNYGNFVHTCYYNKNQDTLISGFKIHNDNDTIHYLTTNFIAAHNDYFISYSTPSNLINKKGEYETQAISHLLRNAEKQEIKENDNPVLFFYKFKSAYKLTEIKVKKADIEKISKTLIDLGMY